MPAVVIGTPARRRDAARGLAGRPAATGTVVATWPGRAPADRPGGGSPGYWHSKLRTRRVHAAAARAAGLEVVSVEADYTAEHGAEATRRPARPAEPPTAILYDNDVMAVAGLGVAQRMGVSVPADVSIVSWDDSALCELVHPALTALHRDIAAVGRARRADAGPGRRRHARGHFEEAPPVLHAPRQHRAGAPVPARPRPRSGD